MRAQICSLALLLSPSVHLVFSFPVDRQCDEPSVYQELNYKAMVGAPYLNVFSQNLLMVLPDTQGIKSASKADFLGFVYLCLGLTR